MRINLISILISFSIIKIYYCAGCSPSNCPPLQGVCDKNVCVCAKDYATVDNEYIKSYGISCNYQTKTKFIAFILELFFPIGVGHIYAEKTYMAILKFCLFLVFIFSFCGELCCLKSKINSCLIFLSVIFILDFLAWMIVQLIDIVSYGLGYYTDGNGVPMI